ncbi:MAG: hypothetical protein C0457_10995 [Polymorphum sp.]|uniref:hypothetical protein n=1 Tax=Pannonibacter phragmitetus TaxID=121719 RepID=UPI000B960E3B|nr:hypothetical protein [Pannonibacter phragmitetus]MBA4205510.1 hypothetical protein [Polymorphum sp.]
MPLPMPPSLQAGSVYNELLVRHQLLSPLEGLLHAHIVQKAVQGFGTNWQPLFIRHDLSVPLPLEGRGEGWG